MDQDIQHPSKIENDRNQIAQGLLLTAKALDIIRRHLTPMRMGSTITMRISRSDLGGYTISADGQVQGVRETGRMLYRRMREERLDEHDWFTRWFDTLALQLMRAAEELREGEDLTLNITRKDFHTYEWQTSGATESVGVGGGRAGVGESYAEWTFKDGYQRALGNREQGTDV